VREWRIGLFLADGLDIDRIAALLSISRNTVRTHVAALREKLGVSSSLAVAAALRASIGTFN
jgi:DNA-binding NarL/FixJ family response regulator